jgi:hypothetical protein
MAEHLVLASANIRPVARSDKHARFIRGESGKILVTRDDAKRYVMAMLRK